MEYRAGERRRWRPGYAWRMIVAMLVSSLSLFGFVLLSGGFPSGIAKALCGNAAAAVSVQKLSIPEAYRLIQENKGNRSFIILDVRTSGEYAEGHVEGALLLDYNSPAFADELKKLDRNKTYLVYCRSGNRSDGAVKMMQELGFTDIREMPGGINAWNQEKFPLVK